MKDMFKTEEDEFVVVGRRGAMFMDKRISNSNPAVKADQVDENWGGRF